MTKEWPEIAKIRAEQDVRQARQEELTAIGFYIELGSIVSAAKLRELGCEFVERIPAGPITGAKGTWYLNGNKVAEQLLVSDRGVFRTRIVVD